MYILQITKAKFLPGITIIKAGKIDEPYICGVKSEILERLTNTYMCVYMDFICIYAYQKLLYLYIKFYIFITVYIFIVYSTTRKYIKHKLTYVNIHITLYIYIHILVLTVGKNIKLDTLVAMITSSMQIQVSNIIFQKEKPVLIPGKGQGK